MLINEPIFVFQKTHPGYGQVYGHQQQILLKNIFMHRENEVLLSMTDSHLFLSHRNTPNEVGYCAPMSFDLKFQVLRQEWPDDRTPGMPYGILLEMENLPGSIQFHSTLPSVLDIWIRELEKKINQRNFHKLFKAKKKIGKGAFATVYLAERLADRKMVAVKAFSKEKQYAGDKGRQALENQIKIMRAFNHCNVMQLEGVFETENSIYIIVEFLEGSQLNEQLKNNRKYSEQEVRDIMRNILRGLAHLNSHKVIHRDLKPENIMFRRETGTDLALCDFGLATFQDAEKYLFVRCGTPGFVAPEIINIKDMQSKSDPVSDVFSAGIIFHYLLFGCSIFPGKKYNQILAQNRACKFDFNQEMYLNLHPNTFNLLIKMLERKPQKRITAGNALNSPYFLTPMEIEEETRPPKAIFNSQPKQPLAVIGDNNQLRHQEILDKLRVSYRSKS